MDVEIDASLSYIPVKKMHLFKYVNIGGTANSLKVS